MKTAGIIAEYNPFHSGHRYQIGQVRARTGADYIVVVMSGDYVQRGEPAIYDKYTRAAIALYNGADLVLEMPCVFATGSAEDFAACGVALLDRLGVVDFLCFGSEAGELSLLQEAASILAREPEEYKNILRARLKDGVSFPKAREEALRACLSDSQNENSASAFAMPNNILGMEYLKALKKRGSQIRPITIKRAGSGYHDETIGTGEAFPSASGLRNAIRQGSFDYFSCPEYHGMDAASLSFLLKRKPVPVFADDLTGIFNWKLLEMIGRGAKLSDFADLSPELEARLIRQRLEFASFSGRVEQLKTKQYTYTRISRALLILEITKAEFLSAKSQDYVSYARVLGFRRRAEPLLGRIKKNSRLPLITKTANARGILEESSLRQLEKDFLTSHLYQSLVFQKSGIQMKNEYTRSVIISD